MISYRHPLIICLPCNFVALEHRAYARTIERKYDALMEFGRPYADESTPREVVSGLHSPWRIYSPPALICLTDVTCVYSIRYSRLQSIGLFAVCLKPFLGRAISCRSLGLRSLANNIHCSLLSRPFTVRDAVSRARKALLGDPFPYNTESSKMILFFNLIQIYTCYICFNKWSI